MLTLHALESYLGSIDPRLAVLILSLLPVIEPRYAVVIGTTVYNLGVFESFLYSLLGLIVLSSLLTLFLESLLYSALQGRLSRIKLAKRLATWITIRSSKKASKAVKYGIPGLIAFVALPLPMTGVYTGSVVGLFLGLKKKELLLSIFIGGLISLAITVGGIGVTRLP